MKRFLEDIAAAAALAEGGEHKEALAILEALRMRGKNDKAKVIFVASEAPPSNRVSAYVANLAARLDSLLLVIAGGDGRSCEQIEKQRSRLVHSFSNTAHKLDVSCFTTRGNGIELARRVSEIVRGVEVVLIHAASGRAPFHRPMRVPV